jgi:hypothetical protein
MSLDAALNGPTPFGLLRFVRLGYNLSFAKPELNTTISA